jgi:ABC-type branched-subunit amino acid transport system substrate-binding protein
MHPDAILRRLAALAAFAALTLTGVPARADILIGQTADFSGPAAPSVRECTAGARLAIDAVNRAGGVHGQPIRLASLDDGFSPQRAADNARQLIAQGAVALFLTRGTPQTQALLPLLAEHGVPLVAPSSGAMLLHRPVNPWVFNVRSSYQHEAERVVQHLGLIGAKRLAILHTNDSFGEDAVQGALHGLAAEGRQPAALIAFDRLKPDFDRLVPAVLHAQPDAVLFIGPANSVADGTARLRAAGARAQVVTLSNNASQGFIRALGSNARGVVVSQVFPDERSASFALVREARDLARQAGVRLTPQMLEGFAGAKVLIEGLRRAGPNPTRTALRDALDSLHHFDLGGLALGYAPDDHTGLDYVDLAIIDEHGRYER